MIRFHRLLLIAFVAVGFTSIGLPAASANDPRPLPSPRPSVPAPGPTNPVPGHPHHKHRQHTIYTRSCPSEPWRSAYVVFGSRQDAELAVGNLKASGIEAFYR